MGILGKLLSSLGLNILICKMGIVVVMVSDFYVDEMSYLYMYKCLNTETCTGQMLSINFGIIIVIAVMQTFDKLNLLEGPSFPSFPLV